MLRDKVDYAVKPDRQRKNGTIEILRAIAEHLYIYILQPSVQACGARRRQGCVCVCEVEVDGPPASVEAMLKNGTKSASASTSVPARQGKAKQSKASR